MDEKRGIGRDNKLLWDIPADLKRFRVITSGHPIIMGRKTFESIGRVLPNRTNIIVTRDTNYQVEGAVVVHSLERALAVAKKYVIAIRQKQSEVDEIAASSDEHRSPPASIAVGQGGRNDEVFVIGGGQIFQQALPLASRLYLTIVEARLDSPPESPARRGDFGADTFFPDYSMFTKKTFEETHEEEKYRYTFLDIEK